MSQPERNDLDDAIDRAAQQIVMHEPSSRLYAAVMADIEVGSGSDVRRTPSPWTTWRWAISGMATAALVAVIVMAWQWQTQRPAGFPALPAPPQMARIAPPPEAIETVASPAGRGVARIDQAHPEIAPAAVAGLANDAQSIQVASIPDADISVAALPVSTIRVPDIAGDDPIPVNTIDADAR
jgi:hypothetical protein